VKHAEIVIAESLVFLACQKLQLLRLGLENDQDQDHRDAAKNTLKACELAECAIGRAKTPLRKLIRRKKKPMTLQLSDPRFGDTVMFASRTEMDVAIAKLAKEWYKSEVHGNLRQETRDLIGTVGLEGVDYQSLDQYVEEQVALARKLAREIEVEMAIINPSDYDLLDCETNETLDTEALHCTAEEHSEAIRASVRCEQADGHVLCRGRRVYAMPV
jgi:hypothetical protein